MLESSTDNRFYEEALYDVLSNPDVSNNIGTPEQIEDFIINSVQYQYRNFSGKVDAIISGEMFFVDRVNNDNDKTFFTKPMNVAQASLTTETFDLKNANGYRLYLNNNGLNDKGIINVVYHGTTTEKPILFDTRLIISATVTVKVD